MIRLYKIKAMLYCDLIILARSKERLVEFLFFPVTTTLLWGWFANYFRTFSLEAAMMLLIINIFWSFIYLAQSAANTQINIDVWSHSLNQLMVSGLNELEYLVSRLLFSLITSVPIMLLMLWVASFYGLVIPPLAPFTFLLCVSLLASTVSVIFIVAVLILLGKEYSFLTWSFQQLVILLSAPFFPIETYPALIQKISVVLPYTWIFECLRNLASTGLINIPMLSKALVISLVYLCLVIPFYIYVFRKSRKTGALVRLGF